MADPTSPDLCKVMSVAVEAGFTAIEYDADRDRLALTLELEAGRKQKVFMTCIEKTPQGESIISIYSPCLSETTEHFFERHPDICRELMLKNSEIAYSRFALHEHEGVMTVYVMHEQLVHTLDRDEIRAIIMYVGSHADDEEMRRNEGKDHF